MLATTYCCYVRTHLLVEERDVGGMEDVVIERGQHTRESRRRGLAQAERLHDGYR